MNHKKYLKYCEKIKKMNGGNQIIIEEYNEDQNDLTNGWESLTTPGLWNCGIFQKNDLLMKCEDNLEFKLNKHLNINDINVFPFVHKIYKIPKYYTIMDKLDGNLDYFINTFMLDNCETYESYVTYIDKIINIIKYLNSKLQKENLYHNDLKLENIGFIIKDNNDYIKKNSIWYNIKYGDEQAENFIPFNNNHIEIYFLDFGGLGDKGDWDNYGDRTYQNLLLLLLSKKEEMKGFYVN
jgi:hypothetical protein